MPFPPVLKPIISAETNSLPLKESFTLEPILLLAAYICDDGDKFLEQSDFKTKGKVLKIMTEELKQERTLIDTVDVNGDTKGEKVIKRRFYNNSMNPDPTPTTEEKPIGLRPYVYWNYDETTGKYWQNKFYDEVDYLGPLYYAATTEIDDPQSTTTPKAKIYHIPIMNKPEMDKSVNGNLFYESHLLNFKDQYKKDFIDSFIECELTNVPKYGENDEITGIKNLNNRFEPKTPKKEINLNLLYLLSGGNNDYKYNIKLNKYKCPFCNTDFYNKKDLENDINNNHKLNIGALTTEDYIGFNLPIIEHVVYEDLPEDYSSTIIPKLKSSKFSSYETANVFEHSVYGVGMEEEVTELPISPAIEPVKYKKFLISPNKTKYTHMIVFERFGVCDEFIESDSIEISIPENTRPIQSSELYSKKLPSRAYRISKQDGGLDFGINRILDDPILAGYKFNKIIIDKHANPILKDFTPDNYGISLKTWTRLVSLYKDIEVSNNLVEVIFPEGDIELDNLKLKNCMISANNSTIKINKKLTIEACYTKSNDFSKKLKSLIFKVKDSIDIKTITIQGLSKLTFLTEEKGKEAKISNVIYDLDYTGNELDVASCLFNISGFANLTLQDINKSPKCNIPGLVLFRLLGVGKSKFINFDCGTTKYTVPLLDIDGGSGLNITKFKDITNSGGSCFNIKNLTGEAIIGLSDCTITSPKLFSISGSDVGELNIASSIITVDKLYSLIDTKPIVKINTSNKTELNFNGNLDQMFVNGTIDSTTIKFINGDIKIGVNTKFTTSKLISSGDLSIYINDNGTANFKDTPIEAKNIKIMASSNSSKTTLELIKSMLYSDNINLSFIQDINMQYSPLSAKNIVIDSIATFKSMESPLKSSRISEILFTNIVDSASTSFMVEETGDFNINTTNVIGQFKYVITAGPITINRNSKDSGILDRFEYKDKIFKLNIFSENCNSSAYILDNNDNMSVSLVCKDFILFKKLDPLDFSEGSVGKKLYDTIHYGQFI